MVNAVSFIIVLGVLIFVHELGHFLVARLADVKVLVFSLGFGPKLLKYRKGETEYAISAVPLGGYVKLLGESVEDKVPEEEMAHSYLNKPASIRMLIAFAGPFFNIAFAAILFFFIFSTGYPVPTSRVGQVMKDTPAARAGLQSEDLITSVNGRPVSDFEELKEAVVKEQGGPVTLVVKREDKTFEVQVTPAKVEGRDLLGRKHTDWQIGIGMPLETTRKSLPLSEALRLCLAKTYEISELTILGIEAMIVGTLSPQNIGGPLEILRQSGKAAQAGASTFTQLLAIISINLGIVNLLPIPILDGGHILTYGIELVTRKKIPLKAVEIAQRVGFVFLILIMAYALFNDIDRLYDVRSLLKSVTSGK